MSAIDTMQSANMRDPNDPEAHEDVPTREPLDEIDVDLDEDLDLPVPAPDPCDTLPEGMEYLGSYASLHAYLRAMLEPEVTPACAWILDHLDFEAIQRRWEGDGSRLVIERGHVYRLAVDLAAHLYPGVVPVEPPADPADGTPTSEGK